MANITANPVEKDGEMEDEDQLGQIEEEEKAGAMIVVADNSEPLGFDDPDQFADMKDSQTRQ